MALSMDITPLLYVLASFESNLGPLGVGGGGRETGNIIKILCECLG